MRGCTARSSDCGLRRRPLPGTSRGAPGREESGLGKGTGSDHLSHHFPPAGASRPQLKLSGLLTSDSRRWLRNASRPLGAACFPLPPPLPLPLAGWLPAPGAAGSSMPPGSAVPHTAAQRSLPGATVPPRAASWAPPPLRLLAAVSSRSPAPRHDWLFDLSERDLEEVGAHSRDFFSLFFFFSQSCGVAGGSGLPSWLPAPSPEFWACASRSVSLSIQSLPNRVQTFPGELCLPLLLHCNLRFPTSTDLCPPISAPASVPSPRFRSRGGGMAPPAGQDSTAGERRDSSSPEAEISGENSSRQE